MISRIYESAIVALGEWLHEDRSLWWLADFIGMGILFVFLGICIFG